MIRITLPTDLAEIAGAPAVDCEMDTNGWIDVYRDGLRLTCFSVGDLSRIAKLLPKRIDSTDLVERGDRRNVKTRAASKPVRATSTHGTLKGNRGRARTGMMR